MSGYDYDVATYDPQGKIHQVAYAQESPKLGAPVVGACSEKCAILLSIRRTQSKLAEYQSKCFKISAQLGCAASGIFADAKKMISMLRSECENYLYERNEEHPIKPLIIKLSDEAQQRTQYMGYKPFGAALLVVGTENNKPALYVTDPNAEYYKFKAHAVGKNAQAVNAYLTEHKNEMDGQKSIEDLSFLVLQALTNAGFRDWNQKAVEIAVVDQEGFRVLEEKTVCKIVQDYQQQHPVVADEESDSK